jgi:hypothetical protein
LSKKPRSIECSLINETVSIRLRSRRGRGFNGEPSPFVQCDQADCQYVDENVAPCPLTLELFAEELEAREERARSRREDDYR